MHKSKIPPLTLLLIPSVLCLFISVPVNAQQRPDLFTYQELVQLYEQETPPDALQNKLQRLLTTPFVSNSATARGVKPLVPRTPGRPAERAGERQVREELIDSPTKDFFGRTCL